MHGKIALLGLCAVLVVACSYIPGVSPKQPSFPKLDYPVAKKGDVVDDYHGVEVK